MSNLNRVCRQVAHFFQASLHLSLSRGVVQVQRLSESLPNMRFEPQHSHCVFPVEAYTVVADDANQSLCLPSEALEIRLLRQLDIRDFGWMVADGLPDLTQNCCRDGLCDELTIVPFIPT